MKSLAQSEGSGITFVINFFPPVKNMEEHRAKPSVCFSFFFFLAFLHISFHP